MIESWSYLYDGDGVRVQEDYFVGITLTSTKKYYFGGAYEVRSDSTTIKYYSFAGQTIMNDGSGLKYFLTDHLGSVIAITDDEGNLISQQRYLPFGAVRSDVNDITQTDYGYTGQRNLDSDIGLMDYKARFYSPVLNRFIQPDSIVPDPTNPQAWNRFNYVGNNPINFNDPTGHAPCKPYTHCVVVKDQRDLTDWLVLALVDSAESPEMRQIRELNLSVRFDGIDKAKAYEQFETYVKDGAKYDVKDVIEADLGRAIKIGDSWYEYSTAGNILYGFYGKAAGFSVFELRAGAGKAQLDDYNRDKKSGKGTILRE